MSVRKYTAITAVNTYNLLSTLNWMETTFLNVQNAVTSTAGLSEMELLPETGGIAEMAQPCMYRHQV